MASSAKKHNTLITVDVFYEREKQPFTLLTSPETLSLR